MVTAHVYFRDDVVYLTSMEKDVFGILHDGHLHLKLVAPLAPHELGDAVIAAFAAYQEGTPGTPYVRGVRRPLDPFLRFAGFKSWKGFEKGAQLFIVLDRGEHIEILPSVPGPTGGFLHQPDRTLRCSRNVDEIGRALIEMASRGKSASEPRRSATP